MSLKSHLFQASATLTLLAFAPLCLATAQTETQAAPPADVQTAKADTVVVTGTRVANRTALDTAVAVDVISGESLSEIGVSEVNQALSVSLPALNFPRPALSDGTDTIRPAGLRGLGPDQTLVLVNGKRRHMASLVNVNGTIGRGTSAVDLNTVPAGAVSSIEVLRDGASAQYGSDAIAGVINVRLREAPKGGAVNVSYGQRETTYKVPVATPPSGLPITPGKEVERDRSDGQTLTVSGWQGLGLGSNGFLTISGEYKTQEHTERPGYDVRQQYVKVNGNFDPREATINRFNAWTGEPELDQITAFANAGYDLSETVELYGWASYQKREATSAGFYRIAQVNRNVIEIYPNGFLPLINPEVTDYSAAGGVRWDLAGWDMDASVVYGSNEMNFTIKNTLNRSLGTASKTVFDAGGFKYDQVVGNLSGVKAYNVGLASPLNVALGLEARREGYEINAGEPDSYRNGGVLLNGSPTASGAQVFPGFRPSNEVSEDRTAVGAYIDLEANVTEAFLISAAVRGESYSDFGETATGKLAARYDFSPEFALRGSVQNGFRAPSLQQQFFATTSTNFIGGVPFDLTTFPVSDPIAKALGAKDLKAEESINYSLGAVLRAGGWNVTLDAYLIEVTDRIVLSENLTQANVRAFLINKGFIGSGGGRFFINGVDTKTQGVDLVANNKLNTESYGVFDLTLGANFNTTDVTKVAPLSELAALTPTPVLFDRINKLTFEKGTPKDKLTGSLAWDKGRFGTTLRAVRYGEVLSPANIPDTSIPDDYKLKPAVLLDLEGRFKVTEAFTLAVGADNITDEYSTPAPLTQNSTGNTPFSSYAPFGSSGRFIYVRASYQW